MAVHDSKREIQEAMDDFVQREERYLEMLRKAGEVNYPSTCISLLSPFSRTTISRLVLTCLFPSSSVHRYSMYLMQTPGLFLLKW